MDRKYKKDSFYAYKAWLSDDPFVHICGKRYIDRVEDVTKVTVYSNLPEVELFVNGESIGKVAAPDHFFYFNVPNVGESQLVAIAGECRDESNIRKVEARNEDYILKEQGAVLNWFDVDMPEGRFSINDKISDIMSSFWGKLWFILTMLKIKKMMPKNKNGKAEAAGFELGDGIMQMMGGFTVLRLTSMMGMMNINFTKEQLLKMNKQLNRIRKPKAKKAK
jgi:beta-galactosidase